MPVGVPYSGPGRYAGLAYIDAHPDIDELYGTGAFNLRAMFRAALSAGDLEASEVVTRFAQALEQLTRGSRNQLANLHHQVGLVMQDEVLEAYRQARRTLGRMDPPYRVNATAKGRDAGGRLENALSSGEFFRGTYDGIGFANRTMLDRQARQWHRLNFGALPDAGARSRPAQITWQGLVVGAIGLPTAPSRPFLMPRGFWTEGGAFRPTGRVPMYRTRGIRAWNFLDAGTRALGREIGPAYETLYGDWVRSAQRGVGPISRVVNVGGQPVRPRPV